MQVDAAGESWIEWDSFSLAEEETVHFSLQNASDLLVNQVIGSEASQIFGKIGSNGRLILVNPAGIFFGKHSQVHSGSLIASTLDLNRDFFFGAKQLQFEGNSRPPILNEGALYAKEALFLVGTDLDNRGSMQTVSGDLGLLAVRSVQFSGAHIQKMEIRISEETSLTRCCLQGSLQNPGTTHLVGDLIFLKEGSLIQASGADRGGTVFIGQEPKAEYVALEKGAAVYADAIGKGAGGTVFLWGNITNGFFGEIYARGSEKGGFVETSSMGLLLAEGMVNTGGGTWLLDPTTVTISTAVNSGISAGNLPPPPAVVPDPYTVPFSAAAANINNTALANALGVNNVIVNAALGAGGAGTITVNGAVAWTAGFTLTLTAPGTITINADVQHGTAATGGVTVISGQNIIVQGAAAAKTSVGSQNSLTSITATGDLTVQGIATGSRSGQVGFYTPNGATATGPIQINCANFTLQAGNANQAGAQIGHGRINVLGASPITAAGADITINATGNALIANGANLNSFGSIGHGNGALPMGANQTGNIRLTCGGNLTMNGTAGGTNSSIQIGHTIPSPNPDNGPVLTGLIDVRVGGNLSIIGNGMIGHGGRFTQTSAQMLNGDINFCCGGNANLTQSGGAIYIGHFVPERGGFPLSSINGNYNLAIAGNLTMISTQIGAGPGNVIIGYNDSVRMPALNGTLNAAICGNVLMSTAAISGNSLAIGLRSANIAGSTSATNILVGGDFTATNILSGFFLGSNRFDFNLAVGGNLTLSQGSSNGFATSGPNGTTRIFAGGTVFGDGPGSGAFSYGRTLTFQTQSIDVRAGADIIWPNSFAPALTAPINFQAGHSFAPGELWVSSGTQITSICGQALALSLLCGTCPSFSSNSPSITSNCGAFSTSPNGVTNVNLTTSSTLTLTSACTTCSSGSPSILLIGAGAANDVTLTNPVGPVTLGPFNTVNVNQDIISTGAISISACQDLNINLGTDITSTGAGSPIFLTADSDNSGSGNLNLLGGNITSNNGQICCSAGPGTFGCTSSNCLSTVGGFAPGSTASVNQTSGAIDSGSAAAIVVAAGNILIDGSATSIGTTSGPVSITAGNNIDINEDIISTSGSVFTLSAQNTTVTSALVSSAGEIRMIAGNDLSLNGTANLASAGSVTLIVDNDFPFQPFIGTGIFSIACTAQITSGVGNPLRIFTALQNLNTFCGTMNGAVYAQGALFQDTATEVWCTYFACPSPYPAAGLGFPFTVFYKNCLQTATQQAMLIIDQFLVDLHPYNEFPGWMERFWVKYEEINERPDEPYKLNRRALNIINHPKSFTQIMPE